VFWKHCGYDDHGVASSIGLALIPLQDFNRNNLTFSFRYSFQVE